MTLTNPQFAGWAAILGGVIGLVGFISLILFFVIGEPFGTLNDLSAVPVALLLIPLVLALYRYNAADHPVVGLIAAIAGVGGFILTATGSALLVLGRIDFEQSLLPALGGLGLIGLWLLLNSAMGLTDHTLPRLLAWMGLFVAIPLTLLLFAVFRTDSIATLMAGFAGQMASAGQISSLAYLYITLGFISYAGLPFWFIGAGRVILAGTIGSPTSQILVH